MLLNEDERAPVKAIDFGLAVPFEREDLPLNLGLEGGSGCALNLGFASKYSCALNRGLAGRCGARRAF
eukprot:1160266-Pelagomonas_calceolata.AAC.2